MAVEVQDSPELQEIQDSLDSLKFGFPESDFGKMEEDFSWEVSILWDEMRESIEAKDKVKPTPTTCELLRNSETYNKLLNIISSNPEKFKNLKRDDWSELLTPEDKLEYIFEKIRDNIVLFMTNKLWKSKNVERVINNTIAPALERNLMELLKEQWNKTNRDMLTWIHEISWDSIQNLLDGIQWFSNNFSSSYNQFSKWMNAVDYLSVHNWVLRDPDKSKVLSNPLEFQKYMNDNRFGANGFSPYAVIPDNIFKIDENQNFEFWISSQEEKEILESIWDIKVVDNPETTALIANMLNKPEKFLWSTAKLQNQANHLLDWIHSANSVTKMFWIDILSDISKFLEKKNIVYKIFDFVCKLIWITWWIEWIVKKRRMERLNFTAEKDDNISQIFKRYKELAWEKVELNITDENSCKTALNDFAVTDLKYPATTKWDYLRDSMVENMDLSLISPAIVSQAIEQNILPKGNEYLKEETITVKWKQEKKFTIIPTWFTLEDKKKLAQYHLNNMKAHLGEYNKNGLRDFYGNISSTEDIALCITASLYADKNDVIEGIKAKVFLPDNYQSVRSNWTVENPENSEDLSNTLSELTPDKQSKCQDLVEKSKTPNDIDYLNDETYADAYKDYLHSIEWDLWLPTYSLECVCFQESGWKLYEWNRIIWSNKWALGLFQFVPRTANFYMNSSKLEEKYWKTFNSRDEFLKDPLATAWAAWIMLSEHMHKYNYNFQSSLACYNRWIGNYRETFGNKSLTSPSDLNKLFKASPETGKYVENICKDILKHNSVPSSNIFANLEQYSWTKGNGTRSSMA